MFTSTLERRADKDFMNNINQLDINIKICTEEQSVTVVVAHRSKREPVQKAESSIKYVSYFTAVSCVTFRPRI